MLPAASYLRYCELLPGAEVADCMPALWSARSRKSEWELARIRAACEQSKAAMEHAPQLLVPGRPECDVLSELAHHMRLHGHEGTIRFRGINAEFFFGQVLAGESGAVPGPTETPLHGPGLSTAQGRGPSRRPLREGDSVVIDVSGLAEGYVSDQTRTFFVGRADPVLLAAYETCRRILAECVALLKPGTPGSALYERGLEVAAEAGQAEHFMGAGDGRVKFVGHCIGLELNEPPYLARGFAQPLELGNVVAIEPKLAFEGLGAVGVENTLPRRRRRAGAAHGRDRGAGDRLIDAGLYRRLFAELAAIGREPGGWNRMAWGPGEDAAREWFRSSATALGLEIVQDPAGNLWAVEPGGAEGPFDAVGSHLDSVADGGAFDGALGVVAGLVAVEAARRAGGAPRPLAVGAMVDEEGPRFGAAIFGSRALCGELAVDEVLARTDPEGNVLRDVAALRGVSCGVDARRARVPAAHRLLDRGARRAGPLARRRAGRARRRDLAGRPRTLALHAARRLRPRRNGGHGGAPRCARARRAGGAGRARPGRRRARGRRHGRAHQRAAGLHEPGAGRGASEPRRAGARSGGARARARRRARGRGDEGVTAEWLLETADPGCVFDADLRAALHAAARAEGQEAVDLAAYAGHDAGVLARHLPAAMLFVRNPTGISHNPAESASEQDCLAACAVLARALSRSR